MPVVRALTNPYKHKILQIFAGFCFRRCISLAKCGHLPRQHKLRFAVSRNKLRKTCLASLCFLFPKMQSCILGYPKTLPFLQWGPQKAEMLFGDKESQCSKKSIP